MSDIVAEAEAWLAEQRPRVSTHSENCHKWHDECLVTRLTAEVERHRMTEDERRVLGDVADDAAYRAMSHTEETVSGYLARTAPQEPSNG